MKLLIKRKIILALLLSSLMPAFFGCTRTAERLEEMRERVAGPPDRTQQNLLERNLPLGNPSGASLNPADRDNYLILRDGYAVSYNNSRGTPNWAAWRLTAGDLGENLERPGFRPDLDLPSGFRRILPTDYSRSGYDRGHLVPSADRFGSQSLNEQTFLMTNIVPQTKDLNQFPWAKLETYTRTLVRKGYDVYVIAGVLGKKERIKRKLTVPASLWKILYIVPRGGSLTVSGAARVIAVEMPNENGIARSRWVRFKTSVRELEQKTGYDFFSALPPAEQDRLETNIE